MTTNLSDEQIRLVNIFESRWEKLTDPDHPDRLIITTGQVFDMLQKIWPSEEYKPLDALVILEYKNIETVQGMYWMLQPKK